MTQCLAQRSDPCDPTPFHCLAVNCLMWPDMKDVKQPPPHCSISLFLDGGLNITWTTHSGRNETLAAIRTVRVQGDSHCVNSYR